MCRTVCSSGTLRLLSLNVNCSCTQPNHHLQHVVSEGRLFNWHSVPISRNGSRFTQFLRGFRTKGSLDKTGGRRGLVPVEEIPGTEKGFRDLFRPFCFTVFVSGCSFAGAAIWQYEHLRKRVKQDLHVTAQNRFYGKAGSYRQTLNAWWNDLLPGQKVVASIIGLNVGVFALWRIVPLQRFMLGLFASSPISGSPCWSMLFSAFSHYSFFHLFANMYVLWSFAPAITQVLGREQFVATYVSAAVISSFTSNVYKIFRKSRVPSLGASGAIMAMIGIVCIHYPSTRLSVAFVDQLIPHSFSADSAMKFLIILDTAGILMGWRFFDHAAHLGGMLFGIWYIKYGHKLIWHQREPLMLKWHDLRGKPK